MPPLKPPYLEVFRHRGKKVAFYRRGSTRTRLRDLAGKPVDPEDDAAVTAAWARAHEAYDTAEQSAKTASDAKAVRPRSIADLIARYRASPEWAMKKPETKRDYEKGLKPLETDWGHLPVAGLLRQHVGKVRDRYAWRDEPDPAKPGATIRVLNVRQANRVVTTLSILLSYAVDPLGWRQDNPALNPKRLESHGEGYRPWSRDEFVQFMERSPEEWRFAGLLALLTGQRGQDQVAMRWADYDGTSIYVVQEKGKRQVKLWIAAHPVLKLELDARREALKDISPTPLTILRRPDGKPWKVNAFQKAAGVAIRAAGLSGVVWHGLRATSVSWAAEGGATENMLMSLAGHTTGRMSQHYARGANQRNLAASAVNSIALPDWTKS
jgi:integrase